MFCGKMFFFPLQENTIASKVQGQHCKFFLTEGVCEKEMTQGKDHLIRPIRERLGTSSSPLLIGGLWIYQAFHWHGMVSSYRHTTAETEGNLPTADTMSDPVPFHELWCRFPLRHRVISSHIRGERSALCFLDRKALIVTMLHCTSGGKQPNFNP